MSTIAAADYSVEQAKSEQVIGKVWRRLIPFLFVLYVINYLDRINLGFAALSMNKDLMFSATVFGLANSIFYFGYVACEIPSNLLLARFGARVWIARILISWGLASAATMLVVGPYSLYMIRFLVGVLEAGFVPGVLLYLTYWIPRSHRARANGYLMMAQPVAMAIGGGMSGLVLEHFNGLAGLQGWRWMFLLEGLPAAILGVVAYFYLTDKPVDATWLGESEKTALGRLLADGLVRGRDQSKASILRQTLEPRILLLALAYFCLVNTLNANGTWIPTIVRDVLKAHSLTSVGFVTAIPALSALILMPIWTRSSDKTQERKWHLIAALAMAATGWLMVIYLAQPEFRLAGLIFTVSGAFSAMSVFWTLPQAILSEEARPAGIGFISAVGLLGSAVSPAVIGILRDLTGSFNAGLFYVTALLVISMALIWIVSRRSPAA
ncbi:MAG TPA: MFS transporter [Bradyrhizobium sp.]|nr:MFS transporter [Bradyrhizobium sp.]